MEICPNYTRALAKNIEERVTQLERELAFLKSQGLTRDEQDSLLDPARAEGSSRAVVWLWIAVVFQFCLGLVFYFSHCFRGAEVPNLPSDQALEGSSSAQVPEKGKPFLLPGMRRP